MCRSTYAYRGIPVCINIYIYHDTYIYRERYKYMYIYVHMYVYAYQTVPMFTYTSTYVSSHAYAMHKNKGTCARVCM
jgi:hypothetical protein